MAFLGLGKFTAHVCHAAQQGHIVYMLKIIVDSIAVRLYGSGVSLQLRPGNLARP